MAMCAAEAKPATTGLRRIGVFGGMFDPVHLGHVAAAVSVRQSLALEKILLIPCGNPAHRRAAQASPPERCAMVALAIADQPGLQLDRRECQSSAPSYTIDTLMALRKQQPEVSWQLLVGVDAFMGLGTWKQWQQLLDLCNVVVMTRPGYPLEAAHMPAELRTEWQRRHVEAAQLGTVASGAMAFVDVQSPALSSTQVRELVKTGGQLGSILHPAVAAHIREHGLYLPGDQD